MKKFILEIEMENAAFDPYPSTEIKRILVDLTCTFNPTKLKDGVLLRDVNGNTVGYAQVVEITS